MSAVTYRNVLWSLGAVLLASLALSGSVDRLSEAKAEDAFTRALVTFAVSRALNGAISVAQGTELAVEPGGVGVVLSLGQMLDPINDLVERFSTVMLVATSSLGLQNLLLSITSSPGFDIALVTVGLMVLLTGWLPFTPVQRWAPVARRVMLFMVFVRFSVAVLVLGSSLVFDVFLESEQEAAVNALEGVQTRIEEINDDPPVPELEDDSLFGRFGTMLDQTLESIDVSDRLEKLKAQVSDASEHIINLIVIFVLQTIILPLAFVWMFVEVLKGIALRIARVD